MPNAMASITRAATRRADEPLHVLTCPTHERYESNLCRTGHRFYAVQAPQVKTWNTTYAPVPDNYTLLDGSRGPAQLPPDVSFDLVLSQNKFGQLQLLSPLAHSLHLPVLSLEHTLPHPSWPAARLSDCKAMRGDVNVFISEFSRAQWGWADDEALVVRHGVDTDVFTPGPAEAKRHVLSVVNQFNSPQRLWCCGFDFWQEATRGLPTLHLGESHDGWSRPATSVADLVRHYRECAVFVDTASASPIPSVVLEAMSSGCVVVSRGNAMVPEVIADGVNGFICPSPEQMRARLADVLARPGAYEGVRQEARRTIVGRFSLARFVADWDGVLRRAAGVIYRGA